MSVLDRRLRRELTAHRWRLLAIVGIIAVGVNEFVALGTSYNNLSSAKQQYYRQCRMADFWINLKKAPVAELDRLSHVPGIAEFRPRIQFYATVDLEEATEPINGLILSLPDRQEPILNDIVLRQGSYFTDRRENEVIVNESFAHEHHLAPGMWIRLLLNNRQQELFVVGTAMSSEFVYLLGPGAVMPDPKHFGVFYLKASYAEDAFDFQGATNQIVGRLTPEMRAQPRKVLDEAERVLDSFGVLATTALADQASNKSISQEIDGLRTFAVIMPIIFLTVAAMVLNVVLTRQAEQDRVVIGTLKALGYTDRQILWQFLKYGFAVGLAGALIGCNCGYWLAEWMTSWYRQFFQFPNLQNHFYAGRHLGAVAIALGCAVLGSFHGTRAVLRLRPAEAMRPKPPAQGGAILLERMGWFWRRLGTSWRMVLRGIVRNRARTAIGVFAATMGAAVMVSGFMLAQATYYLVDFQFRWTLRSDLDLMLKDEHDEGALLEASRLPGVDRAEPVLNVTCKFRNGPYEKRGAITGLVAGGQLTVPRDLEARPIRIPPHGLLMTRKMAEILHVGRGDLVSVEPVQGLRRQQEVPVVGIADSYIGTAVYADFQYLNHLVGEEYAVSGVQLAIDGNREHRDWLYRELKELPTLQAANARNDLIQALEETLIRNLWVVIGLLVLFAGIIFFGSILNASLVSLAERRREVATLCVLGYTPWQIGGLLLRESMIATLLGTLLGLPAGYLLSTAITRMYDSEMFRFPVVWTRATWCGTLGLAVVFALVAHLFVQLAIHRMDWLEALQAKE